MEIRDEVALGAAASLIATIPQILVDFISVQLGFSKYYAFQISGSIYLARGLAGKGEGVILGGLVWEFMAVLLGVLTVYILKFTGRDYWWLKGIAISNIIMFIVIYGFLHSLGSATIIPLDFQTNLALFIDNIVFGLVMGYLISRWGKKILPSV